jgi:hypothetical protein
MAIGIDKALTVHPLVLTRQSDIPLATQTKVYTLDELKKEFLCNPHHTEEEVLQRAAEVGQAFFVSEGKYYSFSPQLGESEEIPIAHPRESDPAYRFKHLEFEPLAEETDGEGDPEDDGEPDAESTLGELMHKLDPKGLNPEVEYEFDKDGAAIPVTPETSAPLDFEPSDTVNAEEAPELQTSANSPTYWPGTPAEDQMVLDDGSNPLAEIADQLAIPDPLDF